MANRRTTRPPTKPKTSPPCESCLDLQYSPIFFASLMTVRNFKTEQEGTLWYHQQGHQVFTK